MQDNNSKKKFLLQWIGIKGVLPYYKEVWTKHELYKDFIIYNEVKRYLRNAEKRSSYVHIFNENDGMVIMTRIK